MNSFHMIAWIAPLAALLQSKLINESDCDSTESLAKFFSGGNCLPQSPENSAAYPQLVSLCGKKTKDGFEGKTARGCIWLTRLSLIRVPNYFFQSTKERWNVYSDRET